MPSNGNWKVESLPRGGLLVRTEAGPIQYGSPPETIKDTMGTKVPDMFILPSKMFSMTAGISLAEMEFPIYYNFFFKQQKIKVVCSPAQQERLEIILKEALFGPEDLDLAQEFVNGTATPGFPDLRAEMLTFRTMPVNDEVRPLELSDVVDFHTVSPDTPLDLGAISISMAPDGGIRLSREGREMAKIDPEQPLLPGASPKEGPAEVFYPPLFGVTTLGAGHGFAPDAMTSGMIIWVNRRGIMVDPPVNSAPELARLGVPPGILDSIILTHCHADHDTGTLQKIMQEGTITLYTTPTIFKSFIRKSAAVTGIPRKMLEKAVRFRPLAMDSPVNINGGTFRFNYSLHSIPTISIQADYGGKSLVYSSDTHNDPDFVNQLFDRGVVSESRRDFLNQFPWDRDLIFHEAGLPPLHTPLSTLSRLPASVRSRLCLVHVTRDMLPQDSDLKIAATGLSGTVELQVPPCEFCRSIEILATYLDQPLFRGLSQEKTMEFLSIAETRHVTPGTAIIRRGDAGEQLFFIMTGQVEIVKDGATLTLLGRSDFFGEKCLFTARERTASATARTDVRLISIHRQDMLAFIRDTPVEAALFHLSAVQNRRLRQQLNLNPIFRHLTPSQKTGLFQILSPEPAPSSGTGRVLDREDLTRACWFIAEGEVKIYQDQSLVSCLGPGSLLGTWSIFPEKDPPPGTCHVSPGATLFKMDRDKLNTFAENNPGFYLKLYAHDY